MSASGRAAEFMRAWGEGHNKPHNPDHKAWGADDCDACTAEQYDPYQALVFAADIMGWRPADPVRPEPPADTSWVTFEEQGPLGGVRPYPT